MAISLMGASTLKKKKNNGLLTGSVSNPNEYASGNSMITSMSNAYQPNNTVAAISGGITGGTTPRQPTSYTGGITGTTQPISINTQPKPQSNTGNTNIGYSQPLSSSTQNNSIGGKSLMGGNTTANSTANANNVSNIAMNNYKTDSSQSQNKDALAGELLNKILQGGLLDGTAYSQLGRGLTQDQISAMFDSNWNPVERNLRGMGLASSGIRNSLMNQTLNDIAKYNASKISDEQKFLLNTALGYDYNNSPSAGNVLSAINAAKSNMDYTKSNADYLAANQAAQNLANIRAAFGQANSPIQDYMNYSSLKGLYESNAPFGEYESVIGLGADQLFDRNSSTFASAFGNYGNAQDASAIASLLEASAKGFGTGLGVRPGTTEAFELENALKNANKKDDIKIINGQKMRENSYGYWVPVSE